MLLTVLLRLARPNFTSCTLNITREADISLHQVPCHPRTVIRQQHCSLWGSGRVKGQYCTVIVLARCGTHVFKPTPYSLLPCSQDPVHTIIIKDCHNGSGTRQWNDDVGVGCVENNSERFICLGNVVSDDGHIHTCSSRPAGIQQHTLWQARIVQRV